MVIKMKSAKMHKNENERIEELQSLNLLDTLPESDYDNIAQLAAVICNTPIALISLVDEKRQWFKSKIGVDVSETPRDIAFCAHAILQDGLLIVENPLEDERFFDNPLVADGLKIRFYAGAPLLSPNGFPLGILCVIDTKSGHLSAQQIDSLKLLSKQLTRLIELRQNIVNLETTKEQLFFKRKAIDNIKEGIVYQNDKGEIIDFNQAALDILCLTAEQITGKTSMDPHWKAVKGDETDFPGHEHPAMVALKTGKPVYDVEMGIKANFNSIKWININAAPIFTKDKLKPSHVVTTFSDTTVAREFRRVLEKNKTDMEFLINSLPHAISHWSKDQVCLRVNKSFLRFYQMSEDDLVGNNMNQIKSIEKVFHERKKLDSVLDGKFVQFERQFVNAMGTVRETMIHMIPNLQQGQLIDFLVVEVDVTELKQLEKNRQELEMKLSHSSRMMALGEMASGIAHEINNPLAIIKGKISLLSRKLIKENVKADIFQKDIEALDRTVTRINNIVRGLSMYSRKHNSDDSFDKVDIKTIIEDTLSLCSEKFRIAGVNLIVKPFQGVFIDCRPAQIAQILTNLLNNSFDAIQHYELKWIEIDVTQEDDLVEVFVKDCGPGISKEITDKMMQPFFTTKEVGKGTGLGLSISSGIAEMHGGLLKYIEAENTCFCLALPKQALSDSSLKAA